MTLEQAQSMADDLAAMIASGTRLEAAASRMRSYGAGDDLVAHAVEIYGARLVIALNAAPNTVGASITTAADQHPPPSPPEPETKPEPELQTEPDPERIGRASGITFGVGIDEKHMAQCEDYLAVALRRSEHAHAVVRLLRVTAAINFLVVTDQRIIALSNDPPTAIHQFVANEDLTKFKFGMSSLKLFIDGAVIKWGQVKQGEDTHLVNMQLTRIMNTDHGIDFKASITDVAAMIPTQPAAHPGVSGIPRIPKPPPL